MRWMAPITALALAACGGGQVETSTPDESEDLEVTSASVRGTALPADFDGSYWRWVEAHCTEGPLDLASRGYGAVGRVHQTDEGFLLVTDQLFAAEQCAHTVVVRATPPDPSTGSTEWQMEEVTRVAVPSTPECYGRPEEPRPGEVRVRDGRLEVLVQRSQWCNGLEVRMVYERAPEAPLEEDQIVRRYVAHFTRGDAEAIAALFAQTGSLLEPFTRTETGDPYRHDGRSAVQQWFVQTFQTAPWRAMRITDIQAAPSDSGASQRVVSWEYMDPRLEEPLTGRTRFTIAAGEIFEAQIELAGEPNEREPEDASAPAETSES